MFTLALPGSPTVTPSGSKDGLIVTLKYSSPSNILSSVIEISNETLVRSAENVTLYGPEA